MLPKLLDPRPYFADLPDPRRETRNKLHKLHDILMIVLCAVLSGVEDWVGMEAFAEEKERWLRGFLELPNGIPASVVIGASKINNIGSWTCNLAKMPAGHGATTRRKIWP